MNSPIILCKELFNYMYSYMYMYMYMYSYSYSYSYEQYSYIISTIFLRQLCAGKVWLRYMQKMNVCMYNLVRLLQSFVFLFLFDYRIFDAGRITFDIPWIIPLQASIFSSLISGHSPILEISPISVITITSCFRFLSIR